METTQWHIFEAGGRSVRFCRMGAAADTAPLPLVLVPAGEEVADQLDAMAPLLQQAAGEGRCRPFWLAGFAASEWNRDYSPWAAPALFAKEPPFSGGGPQTLHWMKTALLPALAERTGTAPAPPTTAILGYSLAGLFALWAFLEGGLFGMAGSCSGSLWFDGWDAYTAAHTPPTGSRVYLSLGDREEKARNPRMAAVGDATRHMAGVLEAAPGVESTLEWNEGGHFHEVPQRMAGGVVWLMRA